MSRELHRKETNMTKLDVKTIRWLMSDRAYTLVEFAYRMGISPKLLDKFLRAEAAPMDYTANMARALGVPIVTITVA